MPRLKEKQKERQDGQTLFYRILLAIVGGQKQKKQIKQNNHKQPLCILYQKVIKAKVKILHNSF